MPFKLVNSSQTPVAASNLDPPSRTIPCWYKNKIVYAPLSHTSQDSENDFENTKKFATQACKYVFYISIMPASALNLYTLVGSKKVYIDKHSWSAVRNHLTDKKVVYLEKRTKTLSRTRRLRRWVCQCHCGKGNTEWRSWRVATWACGCNGKLDENGRLVTCLATPFLPSKLVV